MPSSAKNNRPTTGGGEGGKDYGSGLWSIIGIVINILILYYLLGLEKKHCKCTLDKRHKELKALTIVNIALPIIVFVLFLVLMKLLDPFLAFQVMIVLMALYLVILFIAAIVLWRYVGRLDKAECNCATEDMKHIHGFLMIWRWVMVTMYGIAMLSMLFLAPQMFRK